ncbi:glycosyltransferase family protein [Marinobacterium rhizophilum]|uniref:glycosyltransferase family protein n=1 Tax=Marinobacterium rhizophilum TaxID=420402 RepID=UPI000360F07D|nr:glycosyltransferase [Marinobacterium rhizophilum]
MSPPNTTPARVLFYVQHLLGVGHLRRAALLCEGLVEAGLDVQMVLGGDPVPSITFPGARCHYLSAIRAQDANFNTLVDASGNPLSDTMRHSRRDQLLALAAQIRPDAIITELYPFGRRQMRFELRPLLDWARQQTPRPQLVCSLRDIVQQRSPERELETLQLIETYYSRVWAHGDPRFAPLDASYRLTPRLAQRLHYTGYIAPAAPGPKPRHGVIVSAGGGAVGLRLLEAAIEAQRTGLLPKRPWTLIAGPNLPQTDFDRLQHSLHGPELQLIRFCDDFVSRLAGAELSISQAGYNTVMDLLVSQVPAVVVPYIGSGETEQISRAEQLAGAGRVSIANETDLCAQSLSRAALKALQQSNSTQEPPRLRLDGARDAAADLLGLLQGPRA